MVINMFCDFYSVKFCKTVNNSTTTEAREKFSTDLKSFEFQTFFDVSMAKFSNTKFYLIKWATLV